MTYIGEGEEKWEEEERSEESRIGEGKERDGQESRESRRIGEVEMDREGGKRRLSGDGFSSESTDED